MADNHPLRVGLHRDVVGERLNQLLETMERNLLDVRRMWRASLKLANVQVQHRALKVEGLDAELMCQDDWGWHWLVWVGGTGVECVFDDIKREIVIVELWERQTR